MLFIYSRASGQEVNFQKSALVFSSGVDEDLQRRILSILQGHQVERHDKYLGLPLVVGQSRINTFSSVKDMVWRRIEAYDSKKLSSTGKEVLVEFVLQSIPTYAMSCFKLPKTLLGEIESLVAKFWLGNKGVDKNHCVRWDKLKESKKDGGLGFGDCVLLIWLC